MPTVVLTLFSPSDPSYRVAVISPNGWAMKSWFSCKIPRKKYWVVKSTPALNESLPVFGPADPLASSAPTRDVPENNPARASALTTIAMRPRFFVNMSLSPSPYRLYRPAT